MRTLRRHMLAAALVLTLSIGFLGALHASGGHSPDGAEAARGELVGGRTPWTRQQPKEFQEANDRLTRANCARCHKGH